MSARRLTILPAGDWDGLDELLRGLAGLAEVVRDGPAADVVLLAARGDALPRDAVARVREHAQAPIVLLAGERSPHLLQDAVEADLAEALLLPQAPESVLFAAERAVRARAARRGRAGRVLTVFSPKGGTGKTVTACNLALALALRGRRVLLLDLDVQFGDAAIVLGLEPERTVFDVVTAPGFLDAEKLAAYAARHSSGLDVLAAPLRPEDAELVGGAKATEILGAACAAYDAVVVDTPPFFHESVLAAVDRSDELLLVLAPDVPTLKNARLALQTLELLAFPQERIRFVLNRAGARAGFGAAEIGAVLERRVDVELPDDEAVRVGVDRGLPPACHRPTSPYATAIGELAERLLEGAPPARAPRRRRFALRGSR